ncbi:MAG: thioredoxin family protein [Janthinobacterium lividum]
MNALRQGFLLLLFLLPVMSARAGTALPVHFTVSASPAAAHPGESVTVTIQAKIDPGWHIYSVVPAATGPSATQIVSLGDATGLGPTTEDAPIQKLDPNFQTQVAYHETTAAFTRQFRVVTSTPTVTLHYQTCNNHVCLPPTDVALPLTLSVVPSAVRAEYKEGPPAPILGSHMERKAGGPGASGLGLFLLAALGAGLLALITPCVFPLIPITLTSFVKQADGDKGKLVRLSCGYALGIVALYVALGAVVTATLGAAGINNIAANPWVNLGIFAVFVVFAFSFFETIQLTLPANLTAMQATAKSHGGLVGLALLGITFVLASFTCTAPFLGTLLVAAAGGARFQPLLGMLVFALAFVSPFLVFAAFPQWISKIPKGGIWLARVKATLGFVELAAALKFLSNADQVWNWRILTEPVLLAAWALIFAAAALYLIGTLRFGVVGELEKPGTKVSPGRGLFAVVFGLSALFCFWGLAGRPIGALGTFLPPSGYGGVGTATDNGLPWQADYNMALAQAKAEGKPLFVDFTGVTCTNCRWNEINVFSRPEVKSELAQYVRVQLYTDRPGDAANQKLQLTKFGDVALPLYAVVNPQTGVVEDKYAGTITNTADFMRFLSRPQTASALAPSTAWAAYSPAAVDAASQAGKPIIIDFTAAWCVNCKEIEHDVFENPAVAPILADKFVTLRADLTQWNSPSSAALEKQYGFGKLPTIVVLNPDGTEIKTLRITGRLSVAEFQKRLQAAEGSGSGAGTAVAAR